MVYKIYIDIPITKNQKIKASLSPLASERVIDINNVSGNWAIKKPLKIDQSTPKLVKGDHE